MCNMNMTVLCQVNGLVQCFVTVAIGSSKQAHFEGTPVVVLDHFKRRGHFRSTKYIKHKCYIPQTFHNDSIMLTYMKLFSTVKARGGSRLNNKGALATLCPP